MTPYITINSFSVSPTTTYPGGRLTITYSLSNSSGSSQIVWLGASVKPNGTSNYLNDPSNDVSVSAPANTSNYSTSRYFDTQSGYTVGSYDAAVGIWRTKQGGLMVDNYDRKELSNVFAVAHSIPSVKIVGLIQNAHEDPNVNSSQTAGFIVLAEAKDALSPMQQSIIRYKNISNSLWWLAPPHTKDMSSLGSNHYYVALDSTHTLRNEFFIPGDMIIWRIEAQNGQGNYGYWPSSAGWDTTTILGYSQLRSGLRVSLPAKPSVEAKVVDNNRITIYNNRSIVLKLKSDHSVIDIGGNFLADYLDLLEGRSFPFGIFDRPILDLTNFQRLPSPYEVSISVSKLGDRYDALVATSVNLLFEVSGFSKVLADKLVILEFSFEWFNIFGAVYDDVILNDVEFSHKGLPEKVTHLMFRVAGHISRNDNGIRQTILTKLEEVLQKYGKDPNIAGNLSRKIFACASVLSGVETAIIVTNVGWNVLDFILTPVNDTFTATNKAGHHASVDLRGLPGINNPIRVGSQQQFNVRVKNLSSNAKLYNLWIGLDILHFHPDSAKIENTKTDFIDAGGTNRIGNIQFDRQGIMLRPGEQFEYSSVPYSFTSSVTGFQYRPSKYPYYYICRVWTNGQPGQTAPFQSLSLNEHVLTQPFFIADDIPPQRPTNLQIIGETENTAQLGWATNPADTLDVTEYVVYIGTDSNQTTPIDTIDASLNKGTYQLLKRETVTFVQVSAIDIGGSQSPKSNALKVGPTTDIVEFGQHVEIPLSYALYQNYPNPFNAYTIVRYDLPKEGFIEIIVYDAAGRLVKTVMSSQKEAGTYSIVWNGFNTQNHQVATGTYFYRIAVKPIDGSEPFIDTKKMLLIR
ncbi:MAG: FlgD immunoglobulin-like domain containing protein [Bacteroidota bacterium]